MSLETPADILETLRAEIVQPRMLHEIWDLRVPVAEGKGGEKVPVARGRIPWLQSDLGLVLHFARRAFEAEEYLLVCDLGQEVEWLLAKGISQAAAAVLLRVRMLHARALARIGSTWEARTLLDLCQGCSMEAAVRSEVYSLMGDIVLEEADRLSDRAAKRQALLEAISNYSKARRLDGARFESVIVAAGVARMLGDEAGARLDAEEMLRMLDERAGHPHSFAVRAARADALVVLGQLDEAAEAYAALALQEGPGQKTTLLADARHRSRFLAEAAGLDRDYFKAAFPPLRLILFAGHMPCLDEHGRFPLSRVAEVRARVRAKLQELDARVGIGSAAAGADLIFLHELMLREAPVHVVLPWAVEEFRRTSVDRIGDAPPPEPGWSALYDKALAKAASLRELGQLFQPSDETGWQYMSEAASGLAMLTARTARLDLQPVAVWDGEDGPPGGTASFVKYWTNLLGHPPEILPLRGAVGLPPRLTTDRRVRIEHATIRQEVKTMLFADIHGYSRLTEQVFPEYVSRFLPRVAELAARSRHAPITVNTWGDAIYAVFDFATDAGIFALELIEMIRDLEPEWLRAGLYWQEPGPDGTAVKKALNIRIGLHTGPVFLHHDPIVRRLVYSGAHVNRAARIEPVARPGEVYASEEFAAMAELDRAIGEREGRNTAATERFHCEYAGTMSLPEGYPGRYRIYRLLPRRALEIEELAQAIHDDYCASALERGETAATNTALRPWAALPEDLREANRAQAADIPAKLRVLGYELSPWHGLKPEIVELTAEQVERVARREHDRWSAERVRQGWTYGLPRDDARKRHPSLTPWEKLDEVEREKDRAPVRNALGFAARAGFRLRKLATAGG